MNTCGLEVLQQIHLKVVEASPDAKIVIDADGKIIIFNVQAELLFGYDRSEVLGKPVEMLMPETKRAIHEMHRHGYFELPRIQEMGTGLRLRGLHRRGMEFPIQTKLAWLIIPSAGIFALAVVRRVKEEVETMESLQRQLAETSAKINKLKEVTA